MVPDAMRNRPRPIPERARRAIIWGLIIAIPWVPAAVALAMILTGNVGS